MSRKRGEPWGTRARYLLESVIMVCVRLAEESFVAHRIRGLFLSLIAALIVVRTFSYAQADATASSTQQRPASSNHDLVLILSQDAKAEPPNSDQLKNCLARNVPLACILLTFTVKNEGAQNLLIFWSTCGYGYIAFDLQKSDGTWELFALPPPETEDIPLCTRSFPYVQKLAPGESHVEQTWLANSFLHMDTALRPPDDGRIHPHHPGSAFLTAPMPHKIRLHWNVTACVVSSKLKPGDIPDAFTAQSFCESSGGEKGQQFVVPLQSNELDLPARP
jgi:hypothetical protein